MVLPCITLRARITDTILRSRAWACLVLVSGVTYIAHQLTWLVSGVGKLGTAMEPIKGVVLTNHGHLGLEGRQICAWATVVRLVEIAIEAVFAGCLAFVAFVDHKLLIVRKN